MSEVSLVQLLRPIERPEPVDPSRLYRLLGVRWYGEGLFEKESKMGQEIKAKRLYKIHEGDFVYNRLFAWKGSFAVADRNVDGCYVSNEFPCFQVNEKLLDVRFLRWWFHQELAWFKALGLSQGATPTSRNRLKEEYFLAMKIPLPPLDMQRLVVDRIEELAGQINEARSIRRGTIEETHALSRSMAASVLDRAGEHHPTLPLIDLVTIRGGGTPSKLNSQYWQGAIPWVSPKDMKSRVIHDAIDHISVHAVQETPAKLIDPGAVLIVVRGMILAHTVPSAVLRVPAAVNQDMKALIPRDIILPEFLCCALWAYNSRVLDLVEKSTHDTRKLETDKLLGFRIPVPPIEEQRKLFIEFDVIQSHINTLITLQSETAIELDAVLPVLLNRAFSGQL